MAETTTLTVYSLEEVSKHNTRDDLWMIYKGKVYDCTSFLDEHPGGEEVMIECGGIDATEPFDEVGHSEDALEMLGAMLVGVADLPKKSTTNPITIPPYTIIGAVSIVGIVVAFVFSKR